MSKSRRITEQLREYWQKQRGERLFPAERDIDMDVLEGARDHLFLITVQHEPIQKLSYSYMGKTLVEAHGEDATGRDVADALLSPTLDPLVEQVTRIMEEKHPIEEELEFDTIHGLHIKFRRALFPLGPHDDKVTYILGGVRWLTHYSLT